MEKYCYRKLFSIRDALELLRAGYVLTRAGWKDESKTVIMVSGKELSDIFMYEDDKDAEEYYLILVSNDEKDIFCWHPSVSDLTSDDWYVIGREDEYGVLLNANERQQ